MRKLIIVVFALGMVFGLFNANYADAVEPFPSSITVNSYLFQT